jgi:quaternary ammonium compound-resistance protein SugE
MRIARPELVFRNFPSINSALAAGLESGRLAKSIKRPRPRLRCARAFKSGTARQPLKEAVMAWIYLAIAGVLEVVWAFSMKQSEGFSKLGPSLVTLVAMIASFALLSLSMKSLPLGTAYTIWTGIGAVGAFLVGIFILGEQANAMRIAAALLIVGGLVLMKISSPA